MCKQRGRTRSHTLAHNAEKVLQQGVPASGPVLGHCTMRSPPGGRASLHLAHLLLWAMLPLRHLLQKLWPAGQQESKEG